MTPADAFIRRLLHPDDLGYAVTAEVRQLAAAALAESHRPAAPHGVYLCGPMTGLPGFNFQAFNAAAARLRVTGLRVVNPAELNPDPNASWETCLRTDLRAMLTCATITHLPGWEKSPGTHLETHVAHRVGLHILPLHELERAQP
jgi:hypothetical protein